MMATNSTCVHVDFSNSMAHWRFGCFKVQTQNLTSVFVESISTWSTSPGPNSPTFTWSMVQCMVMAGKCRRFIMSVFQTECVQNIICLRLLTIAYVKLVHLQWTGKTQGKDDQFACHNLMRTFWEQSLHKHPRGWSCSWCGSLSCVEQYM